MTIPIRDTAAVDVAAYLRRIGVDGEVAPDLPTLFRIVERHTRTIPFENLDPLLGRGVCLEPAVLWDKLVRRGRGGYCFEHSGLLHAVLDELGFAVTALLARVRWGRPDGVSAPRTHQVLLVEFAPTSYLVDVGFGGPTPTAPLALVPDRPQATGHEPCRLRRDGEVVTVEVRRGAGWRPAYDVELQPQSRADLEVANHYTATHPASRFTTALLGARAPAGRRIALADLRLAVHHADGRSEQRQLTNVDALRAALEEDLAVTLPADLDLAALFDRLAPT
ncbi:arylamine N-acetyltransferase family protein [Egicoccus halophilus]|uniref:Arylamine N-acetyltransferase n=1 Tax=Egicoccus halophilus TaxID=1670830 RepID=A0A8J3ETK7_9ACTN|nr:arylamine N-acetyltransferase [Egicoccus halophilus]GGI04120.1 arylamine N-acetyltransferase [Egicoccus halophilus]